jgi:hypothetical protein
MIQGKSGDAQPPGKTQHFEAARFGFKENRQGGLYGDGEDGGLLAD